MKAAAKQKKTVAAAFADQYRSALREYADGGDEGAFGKAYELGRRAIDEGRSLLEIAALFELDLSRLGGLDGSGEERGRKLKSAAQFFAESISPYEMAHRGFQDALKALRRFNETLEEEIKRIAHAVHDDAGQSLVAVHLALEELSRTLTEAQREQVAIIEQSLDQVEKQLRHYSHELRPTVLDDLGWVPAIRFLAGAVAKRANLRVEIKTKVLKRLPSAVEIALYRIVQEALTNVIKHANATRVAIQVSRDGGNLSCLIQDNGKGFDVGAVRSNRRNAGLGLVGMQERANAIGGSISIDSSTGRGTKLLIRIPTK
jgi:signal transduction histidine kinase